MKAGYSNTLRSRMHSQSSIGVKQKYLNAPTSRKRICIHAISSPISPTSSDRISSSSESLFVDKDGKKYQVMAWDYGFRSGSGRLYEENYGKTPGSVLEVALANFKHEWLSLRCAVRYTSLMEIEPSVSGVAKVAYNVSQAIAGGLANVDLFLEKQGVLKPLDLPEKLCELRDDDASECKDIRQTLADLKLEGTAVSVREAARVAKEGDVSSPIWVTVPFLALCWLLDTMYAGRAIPKFWVLETVARIPYFSYISILHLYESLGFWRAGAELRKIHFAQEWNEMHHLQIMESLGGDLLWFDRFVADHAAISYYWLLIGFYLVSPKLAYNFMQRVELHAYDTYCEFVEVNKEVLQSLPPPRVALEYYKGGDLYLFDELQTSSQPCQPRRPRCDTLYDVFCNIRDDESEHVKTMVACQKDTIAQDLAMQRKNRS